MFAKIPQNHIVPDARPSSGRDETILQSQLMLLLDFDELVRGLGHSDEKTTTTTKFQSQSQCLCASSASTQRLSNLFRQLPQHPGRCTDRHHRPRPRRVETTVNYSLATLCPPLGAPTHSEHPGRTQRVLSRQTRPDGPMQRRRAGGSPSGHDVKQFAANRAIWSEVLLVL